MPIQSYSWGKAAKNGKIKAASTKKRKTSKAAGAPAKATKKIKSRSY